MRKHKLLILSLVVLLGAGLSFSPVGSGGADQPDFPLIYIDEGCAGTHVGSLANPYDDFADINWDGGGDNDVSVAVAANEDVVISLMEGDTWRETLTVGTSGSAAHPITITSYGAGADPIIDGEDTRNTCILIEDLDYVTVNGIRTTQGLYYGVYITGDCTNITIDDVTADNCGLDGISMYNDEAAYTADVITIQNCTCYSNLKHGIEILGEHEEDAVSTVTIDNNTTYNNATSDDDRNAGIHIKAGEWGEDPMEPAPVGGRITDLIVSNNHSYSNGIGNDPNRGYGIYIDQPGSGCIIQYNKTHDNNWAGILVENGSGTEVNYNLSYGNGQSGIYINRTCVDCEIYNNTLYDNLIGLTMYATDPDYGFNDNLVKNNIAYGNTAYALDAQLGGANDGINGSGNIYSHNCFGPEAASFINWDGVYSTYDTWEAEYGGTTNSIEADPLMTDPANDDFTLQNSSPCIDKGTDVSLTEDYTGKSVPHGGGIEIGAFENGTDFYVKNGGNDAASGLDDDNAWETIAKVNGASFSGDDIIYFNRGDIWREGLIIPDSGTSGHQITFGAYGTGANPIISGADLKTDEMDWGVDDFETGDFTKWVQQNTAGTNAISVIGAAKYAGTYGMRTTYDGTNAQCNTQVGLDDASGDITLEVYVRLSADFDLVGTYAHQAIAMIGDDAALCVRQNAEGAFLFMSTTIDNFDAIYGSAVNVNQWYRLKLRHVAHASTGGHELWMDSLGGGGYVLQGSNLAQNTSGDTVSTVFVGGFDIYRNTTVCSAGVDIDFDDVIVTTNNGTAYRSTSAVGWGATQGVVIQDGLHLEPNVTSVATLTEGQYYLDGSDFLWVYPTGGGNPADYTTEVSVRNRCIDTDGQNYLILQNLNLQASIWGLIDTDSAWPPAKGITGLELDSCTLKNAYNYGLVTHVESDDIVVHDCTFREIGRRHIYIDGTDTAGKNTLTAYDNTFTMDGEGYTCKDASGSAQCYAFWCDNAHGSQIYSNIFTYLNFFDDGAVFDNTNMNMISMQGCDGIAIYSNTITGGRHGMQLDSCVGVDIYKNRLNKTRDDFIWLYTNCSGTNNIYLNVGSYSGDDGIVIQSVANVYNNIVAYISDTAIIDFSTTNGAVFKNNIAYMWGTNSDDTTDGDKAFQSTTAHEFTADNNCWFSDETEAVQEWRDNPDDLNFAQWQTAGFDTNGLNTDPLFTDPANDDFTLQATSPCIDAGTDVSLTEDYNGSSVPLRGDTGTNKIFVNVGGNLYVISGDPTEGSPDIGVYEYLVPYKFWDGHLYFRLSETHYLRITQPDL